MKALLKWAVAALVVFVIGIQLIPLNRANPPVTREVRWDSPATRALAKRACFDCHSNETVWPVTAYVAPASFLIVRHVWEGRGELNFSEWDKPNASAEDVVGDLNRGKMPRWDYLLMHSEARLTAAEKEQLLAGLAATFRQDPPAARPRGGRR